MENILNNLCAYDPRNPNRILLDEYPPFPNPNCACDNCFYGRTKLAEKLLLANEAIDKALEQLEPYGRWREADKLLQAYKNAN